MQQGFLGKLFDTSFKQYVTPQIIKVLFWLGVGVTGLITLVTVGAAFMRGFGEGLLYLLLSPLFALLWVIFIRVNLELISVAFRVVGLLENLVQNQSPSIVPAAPRPAPAAPIPSAPEPEAKPIAPPAPETTPTEK